MTNNTELPAITKEMLEAYQAEQAQLEQSAMQRCVADLQALATERGYEIVAIPQLLNDGRLGAVWGVRRKSQ